MEEKHRYILEKNRGLILNDLDVEKINNYLIQEFIFTPDQMQKIIGKATRKERAEFLLDSLPRQDQRTFYVFLETLRITYPHLYDVLLIDSRNVSSVPKQPVQCTENQFMMSESMKEPSAYEPEVDHASRRLASQNERVSERDLARVASHLSGDFNIIAGMLGLTSAELYQSQVQHQHSVKDQYFAILYTWRRKNGYAATKANLVRLLQEMNVDCSVYDFLFM
ncbi:death domain-containing protein CRADD-like [Antedon mediterranea]|uniref:death domain-containing protein CRADD-like n=1 Tax=Antedon mediterranea TaxID=105859 RepID=UPI003AF889F5